jgi:hypothetical protein
MTTVLIVVAALMGIVVVLALLKPDTFVVTRQIEISAAPQVVHELLRGFQRWDQWNPWQKLDSGMKQRREGASYGVGAIYAWDGNKQAGAGRMEVVEIQPGLEVKIKLDFFRPFKSQNQTVFRTEPTNLGTLVTWTMTGPMPFISKLMTVFVSMDRMIGKDFEEGLLNLRILLEDRAGTSKWGPRGRGLSIQ